MSQAPVANRVGELREAVSAADSTVFLVEGRIMRRLLRKRTQHPSLALALPHEESHVAPAEQVLGSILPDELGLRNIQPICGDVLLIKLPNPDQIEHWPLDELKLLLWRRLFHAQLDRALLALRTPERFAFVQSQIDALGQVEFDEAHHVLRAEMRLLDPDSRVEAFCEWVALFWEYRYFDPDTLDTWFPSIQRIDGVADKMRLDLPIEELLNQSRISGSASIDTQSRESQDEVVLKNTQKRWSVGLAQDTSERKYLRYMRRRDRATDRGNTVHAISSSLRAARSAPSRSKRSKAESTAESDLRLFVKRLREAIGFPASDNNDWHAVLLALARNAIQGFWNSEKRLLYDLQKVCLDKERISYRVDLLRWVTSLGAKPLSRPLYNLQEVLMAKHLASATARLTHVRLSGVERDQLTLLLEQASHQADSQMRLRIREPLRNTLLEVGMTPSSFPERIAMDKLVEDALDCISERGYISMGYFRDAVSKNDLKLPDLHGLREAWSGDRLLKADDRLDQVLDGVYRKGDFYLRWIQMISAMFFGTTKGRFATLFLIIPFGGALVLIESIQHIWHKIQTWTSDHPRAHSESIDPIPFATESQTEPASTVTKTADQAVDQIVSNQLNIIPLVIVVGLFLMALIHLPRFRLGLWKAIRWVGQLIYAICIRLPQELLPWASIRSFFEHPWTQTAWSYWIKPATLVLATEWLIQRSPSVLTHPNLRMACEAIVLSALMNSRLGRDVQELLFEAIGSFWNLVRLRWVVIAIDWIVELFRGLLLAFERFLYAVDEWLRFHSQESLLSLIAKAILGFFWSVISFLIRIYINLLIEPTLHPVKHFPVVTVAHKIFLPVLLILAVNLEAFLTQYMNKPLAISITWFNIVFLPGFFGFAVWELKENWRLFRQNRRGILGPIPVGSHGETIERLLRPGFHSGTLPKLFRNMRRLENQTASVKRFTKRRSAYKKLHHVTDHVHRCVDRELIAMVNQSLANDAYRLECSEVIAATNSLTIRIKPISPNSQEHKPDPFELVIQEQSGWIVAWTRQTGGLDQAPEKVQKVVDLAILGFMRKCGVFLIRAQVESEFSKGKPYDVQDHGLVVWSDESFLHPCTVEFDGPHVASFQPSSLAKTLGLADIPDRRWIFAASQTTWTQWEQAWNQLAEPQTIADPTQDRSTHS
ncbi:MAG: hypothetical protein NTV29_06070 [Planctomycetota bacterium]|nr:hypothetical protein [Planctomycetota bacterium]